MYVRTYTYVYICIQIHYTILYILYLLKWHAFWVYRAPNREGGPWRRFAMPFRRLDVYPTEKLGRKGMAKRLLLNHLWFRAEQIWMQIAVYHTLPHHTTLSYTMVYYAKLLLHCTWYYDIEHYTTAYHKDTIQHYNILLLYYMMILLYYIMLLGYCT